MILSLDRVNIASGQLSPHLLESEFIATAHRALWSEQQATWQADDDVRLNALRFAGRVFEPVRWLLGPLHVTSGFRCRALNAAVGGRPNSRHVLGLAADVIPLGLDLREAMRRIVSAWHSGDLQDVDEAILESGWIHIQGTEEGGAPRRLAMLTRDGVSFAPFTEVA